jgi:hypothetical protein
MFRPNYLGSFRQNRFGSTEQVWKTFTHTNRSLGVGSCDDIHQCAPDEMIISISKSQQQHVRYVQRFLR